MAEMYCGNLVAIKKASVRMSKFVENLSEHPFAFFGNDLTMATASSSKYEHFR